MKKRIVAMVIIFATALAPYSAYADETANEPVDAAVLTESEEKSDSTAAVLTENEEKSDSAKKGRFSDVPEDSWYAQAVNAITDRKIMNGVSEDMFDPDEFSTRGMLAVIIYNMDGTRDRALWSYLDVAEGKWYTDAIAWCSEKNIMKGYGNGIFAPDDVITREQLVSILYRYAEYRNFGNMETAGVELLDFSDNGMISGYAGGPMQWAIKNGIISGKEDKTLDPKGQATRAETAQIIHNFMTFYSI